MCTSYVHMYENVCTSAKNFKKNSLPEQKISFQKVLRSFCMQR